MTVPVSLGPPSLPATNRPVSQSTVLEIVPARNRPEVLPTMSPIKSRLLHMLPCSRPMLPRSRSCLPLVPNLPPGLLVWTPARFRRLWHRPLTRSWPTWSCNLLLEQLLVPWLECPGVHLIPGLLLELVPLLLVQRPPFVVARALLPPRHCCMFYPTFPTF